MTPELKEFLEPIVLFLLRVLYLLNVLVLYRTWLVRVPLALLVFLPVEMQVLIIGSVLLWHYSDMRAEFLKDLNKARFPKLDPRRILRLVVR